MDGTLLGRYNEKMFEFEEMKKNASDPATAALIEREQIEYMLNAAPFLHRYNEASATDVESDAPASTNRMNKFITRTVTDKRGSLYLEYLLNVERRCPDTSILVDPVVCEKCGPKSDMIAHRSEAVLVCSTCGASYDFQENVDNLTYDQERTSYTTTNFAYKRSNHLAEHLACFQGKETTNIPESVFEALRSEFKKRRVRSSDISSTLVLETLRKLRLNKFYEHSTQIAFSMSGNPPPTIDVETEETLKAMFNDIQQSFEKNRPPNRKNFMSYNYVIKKMCELIERDDLAACFPLLKSREKLHQQDCIWQKICQDLRYQFIPSL